jgi:hypothetical protein
MPRASFDADDERLVVPAVLDIRLLLFPYAGHFATLYPSQREDADKTKNGCEVE